MKTADKSFSGFPACWNMVALVLFALRPSPEMALGLIVVLAGAMFLPLRFIHPVRTRRWRRLSIPVALGWTVCAAWEAATGFAPADWAHWGLVLSSLYLLLAGIAQQLLPVRAR